MYFVWPLSLPAPNVLWKPMDSLFFPFSTDSAERRGGLWSQGQLVRGVKGSSGPRNERKMERDLYCGEAPPSMGFSRQEYWNGVSLPGKPKNTGVSDLSLLQGIFSTQGLNPGPPRCRQILSQLSHKGSPRISKWVAYPFSSRSSRPKNPTAVSCIVGGFFTN